VDSRGNLHDPDLLRAEGYEIERSPTPLSLGERLAGSAAQTGRGATPEPEGQRDRDGDGDVEMLASADTDQLPSGDSTDPSHQPYLGRVDELDTGPLAGTPPTNGHTHDDERELAEGGQGTGEGGNMTPHGMSERPVPISSTTQIAPEERRISGRRRATSSASLSDRFVSGGVEQEDKKE